MININNKTWEKLKYTDIETLLNSDDDETMFFEFKNDQTSTTAVAEEVCAFSNTYGGYLILGVENDKRITGCTKWTEQKIHTTLHDSITPTPIFDVRKFKTQYGIVFVVRIEEGHFPPYITIKGKILQRVSSGSFTIKETSSLNQMFNKRKDRLSEIEEKIFIDEIRPGYETPNNLCAYLDLGFSPVFHDMQKVKNIFYDIDMVKLSELTKELLHDYTISRFGYSLLITIGEMAVYNHGKKLAVPAGINNFIEIMRDGSVRCRVFFCHDKDSTCAITTQTSTIDSSFAKIYKFIFGDKFYKNFISAEKYEKLVVLKQFTPVHRFNPEEDTRKQHHQDTFGGNIFVTSNRIPKSGFSTIEKSTFDKLKIKYNNETLIDELFYVTHHNMGLFSDAESGYQEQK